MADSTYFVSALYPVMDVDAMTIAAPAFVDGHEVAGPADGLAVGIPSLCAGTLEVTVPTNYVSNAGDAMSMAVPAVVDGTLVFTLPTNYTSTVVDTFAMSVPTFLSGTLQ